MTGWRCVSLFVLGSVLLLCCASRAAADAIPIGTPAVHDHVESHTCTQHPPTHICTSVLAPDPLDPLSGPSTPLLNLLGTSFPTYTFQSAASAGLAPLGGSFTVHQYRATDSGAAACMMGGLLSVTYNPGPNDPANLRWIQMVDYLVWEHPGGDSPGPVIDPRRTDYTVAQGYYDSKPFYYSDALYQTWGLMFNDDARMDCPCPNGRVSVYFQLHLASYDSASPNTIRVHGGIGWGYDIYCKPVPEPTTLALFGFGAAGLIGFRRRRRVRR